MHVLELLLKKGVKCYPRAVVLSLDHDHFLEYSDSAKRPSQGFLGHLRPNDSRITVLFCPDSLSAKGTCFLGGFHWMHEAGGVSVGDRYVPFVTMEDQRWSP
jgi:hypothetical protein